MGQARIVGLNSKYFLKKGGHLVMSIKANCVDSTMAPEHVIAAEVETLRTEKFFMQEQVSLLHLLLHYRCGGREEAMLRTFCPTAGHASAHDAINPTSVVSDPRIHSRIIAPGTTSSPRSDAVHGRPHVLCVD